MIFCAMLYALLCIKENRERDRKQNDNDSGNMLTLTEIGGQVDKEDLSDVQNKYFRYVI